MGFIEKIILTAITYMLIMIFGLLAVILYLMVNDSMSMITCFVVMVLFYTLTLIEEQ